MLMKKIALFFGVAVLISLFSVSYVSASIDDTTLKTEAGKTVSGFRYEAAANDSVKITGYFGSSIDLVIPDFIDSKKVTEISSYAFYVDDYVSVSIPESVTSINEGAFKYCEELITVTFRGNGLVTIGDRAFDGCKALTSFTFPISVTTIGESAFINTHNLKSITIPTGITTFGDGIFYNSALENVTLENGLTVIGKGLFMACDELSNVIIPESVSKIEDGAFSFCSNLTNITIQKSVTSIGKNVFYGSGIKTISCYQNSVAYNYAVENNFAVTLLGPYFSKDKITVYIGSKSTLKVLNSINTTNWESSNSKVVKVSQTGMITALKKGSATISAIESGNIITCKITVRDFNLNKKSATVTTGKKLKLKLNGASGKINWKSSNSKVAKVSNKGVVTGIKTGSVKITALLKGKKYTCKVNVKKNEVKFTDFTSWYTGTNAALCITKISYSGTSMVVEGYVINNSPYKVVQINSLTLNIYSGNNLAARQTFTNYKLNLSTYAKKKVKFIIKSKNIKKKHLDLRNGNISPDFSGTYRYTY